MPEAAYVDSAESLSRVLKSAVVDRNTATSHAILSPEAGKGWVIHGMFLQAEVANTFILKSGSTALTGTIDMAAPDTNIGNNAIFMLPQSSVPWFRSVAAADDIVLTLGLAQQVNGWISYALTEQIT